MANYYRVTAGPVFVELGNGDTHTFVTNDLVDPAGEYYHPLAAIPGMLTDSGTPTPTPGAADPLSTADSLGGIDGGHPDTVYLATQNVDGGIQ